jgi:hypothetical protein
MISPTSPPVHPTPSHWQVQCHHHTPLSALLLSAVHPVTLYTHTHNQASCYRWLCALASLATTPPLPSPCCHVNDALHTTVHQATEQVRGCHAGAAWGGQHPPSDALEVIQAVGRSHGCARSSRRCVVGDKTQRGIAVRGGVWTVGHGLTVVSLHTGVSNHDSGPHCSFLTRTAGCGCGAAQAVRSPRSLPLQRWRDSG